jgi:hypothetical protein
VLYHVPAEAAEIHEKPEDGQGQECEYVWINTHSVRVSAFVCTFALCLDLRYANPADDTADRSFEISQTAMMHKCFPSFGHT